MIDGVIGVLKAYTSRVGEGPFPTELTGPVFSDPDLAARERTEFFSNHPQMIGLSGDLPEPGSFLTVNELDVPILATRTEGGEFKAFVNACRHRGTPLAEGSGCAKAFVCPYHGWSYQLDGRL